MLVLPPLQQERLNADTTIRLPATIILTSILRTRPMEKAPLFLRCRLELATAHSHHSRNR